MATATLEEPALVSQPETKLLFMSRRSALRLTKRPRYPIRGPHGQVEGMTPGEFVAFREGVFRCPPTGTVQLVDSLDGGVVEVDAEELVEWLMNHRLYGNREEGFWRVDPTAPAPSKKELQTLVRLAQQADVAGLERLIEQERAGWNRPDLLEAAEEALEASRQVVAELERQQAAETAKAVGKAQQSDGGDGDGEAG